MDKEENKNKEIELHSEEVQEIMGEMPSWLLCHGITVLFVIVIFLLVGSWFFKYPDVIQTEIVVTSMEQPATITAHSTGKIDSFLTKNNIKNNIMVTAGTPLAVIQNPAKTQDMLTLIKMIHAWEASEYSETVAKELFTGKSFSLGPVQYAYNTFVSCLDDYLSYKESNYYTQRIALQKLQMLTQKEYYNDIVKQVSAERKQLQSNKNIVEQDSIRGVKKMIPESEYNTSLIHFMQNKQSLFLLSTSVKQTEIQLMRDKENLLKLQQQAAERETEYRLSLQNAKKILISQVRLWERNYLLSSPINGIITPMYDSWNRNQNVKVGEVVFMVMPANRRPIKGKALLPAHGAGKVQVGQRVNVRISNFPDLEFGYLLGKVEKISNIPDARGFYAVDVSFPNGMKTNYGKLLPVFPQMRGNADIITENLRLIERFFMPIKKIIKKQQ